MIFTFKKDTSEAELQRIVSELEAAGIRTARSPESRRPILAAVDPVPDETRARLEALPHVDSVTKPRGSWRRVDRAFRELPTVVDVSGVPFGARGVAVIAGPCSVESEEIIGEAAETAKRAGAHVLRGGGFKPRTSPYAFQGLGKEGLRLLKAAGDSSGMPVVSEIMDASQLPAFLDHDIDCLQVGARNMQNFTLLKAIAGVGKPVMLKRGLSATLKEWLQAAEYLAAYGCDGIILCERGIRTFETATRNTLDLTVLPLLRQWTHLPIIVDPSHAAGIPALIPPLSRASIAAGADGVAVECHPRPAEAKSDGAQALLPGELATLVAETRVVAAAVGRTLV
ncbi:MAG: 3-deoxy-7-phosphoheptulonate synthase [Planctomycetota bacterium]|nr:3-deoxy-7-phosphoheptulonate synthase [Planctomycetota bacterium]MEE2938838.1 3-deoxy-7-phosphoheptulonate synthase [Planctomycetota bacterium]